MYQNANTLFPKRLNEQGFTLLEILTVMVIISFVLISMFQVINLNYATVNEELHDQEDRDNLRVFTSYLTKDLLYSSYVSVDNEATLDLLTYQDYKGDYKVVKFDHSRGIYEVEDGNETLIAKGIKHDITKPMAWMENGRVYLNVYAEDINALLDLSVHPRVVSP